jgi:hypothetical protein
MSAFGKPIEDAIDRADANAPIDEATKHWLRRELRREMDMQMMAQQHTPGRRRLELRELVSRNKAHEMPFYILNYIRQYFMDVDDGKKFVPEPYWNFEEIPYFTKDVGLQDPDMLTLYMSITEDAYNKPYLYVKLFLQSTDLDQADEISEFQLKLDNYLPTEEFEENMRLKLFPEFKEELDLMLNAEILKQKLKPYVQDREASRALLKMTM